MPSFADYQRLMQSKGKTVGKVHTYESQDIVEHTWYDDPSSCIGYLYSYEYDDEPDKNIGLHPEKSKTKIPVDVKFLISSYQSLDKDNVDYRIMFKPSYKCNVPYYNELFKKKCSAEFPIGLFVDLPDEKGIYRRWLIVAGANTDNGDFPNWSILFCDYDFKWVYNGKKYHCWGVGRSQSSYNSGLWVNYVMTAIENQRKFILPYNEVSKTVFYDQRLIISPPLETPICWKISKVEGINPLGVITYTCVQDRFNPHTDWIEKDEDDNWIAAWADYYKPGNIEQKPEPDSVQDEDYALITYSGTTAQIKVGGSYKTITITYYNSDELLADQQPGDWSFWIDDVDVSDLVQIKNTDIDNTIKIKFLGDEHYLSKILVVKNVKDNIVAELNLEILSL